MEPFISICVHFLLILLLSDFRDINESNELFARIKKAKPFYVSTVRKCFPVFIWFFFFTLTKKKKWNEKNIRNLDFA